jgi:hypothetical protein
MGKNNNSTGLGLGPTGYSASPDSSAYPSVVLLNLLERRTVRKPPHSPVLSLVLEPLNLEEKDYDPGLKRVALCKKVDGEPVTRLRAVTDPSPSKPE